MINEKDLQNAIKQCEVIMTEAFGCTMHAGVQSVICDVDFDATHGWGEEYPEITITFRRTNYGD